MNEQVPVGQSPRNLTSTECLGFRTLLASLEFNELITVMDIITRPRRINADNRDQAIDIILESAGNAIVILGRQKVSKSIILNYLLNLPEIRNRPPLPNSSLSKLELSNKCLQTWRSPERYQELDQVSRNLVEAFFTALNTPSNPDLDDHQNKSQYYEAIRNHIWDNCQLLFVLPNYSNKFVPSDILKYGFEDVMSFLFLLKNKIKITFNLNDDRNSLCVEQAPNGLIKINIPGICRREDKTGTFDLILTYSEEKINDIKLTVDGCNIQEMPRRRNILRMESLIELFQTAELDEVTPQGVQEISE